MTLADWLRDFGRVAAEASRPEVTADAKPKTDAQRFIPLAEITPAMHAAAAGRPPGLFDSKPNPDNFPMPEETP